MQPVDAPPPPPIRIEADDQLLIQIYSPDPEAAAFFKVPTAAVEEASGPTPNYLVDPDGNIDVPMIGTVQARGLTVTELRDEIKSRLSTYLRDPIVNVRFGHLKFSILGEVKNPGSFSVPEERVTALEALGLAGDITNYGNRTNILVIRETAGQREFGYLNLQDRGVFQSPYFYLRPNDVLYVEPTKAKVGSVSDQVNKVLPWVGAGVTILNLIVIIATRL